MSISRIHKDTIIKYVNMDEEIQYHHSAISLETTTGICEKLSFRFNLQCICIALIDLRVVKVVFYSRAETSLITHTVIN